MKGDQIKMPESLQGLTEVERALRVQANFIAYFRLFEGLPDVHFTETDDATWIVADFGAPGNHMLRAQFSEESADRRINEVISDVGELTSKIDWYVFPGSSPDDLGQRLAARGQAGGPDGSWDLIGEIGGPGGNWMIADLTTLSDAPTTPDGFHVERVINEVMLEQWRAVSAAGFGGGDLQVFSDAYARHGFGDDAIAIHYIGYLDNGYWGEQPVTSATLLVAGGSASIYNVSTPEDFRRRGFGGAITYAGMQEAKRRGYVDTWIWSSNQGKGVYGKLGYVPMDFGVREYQWKRTSAA